MRQFSMWWVFLFVFALAIGGVQSLGMWTRTASAQAPSESTSTERGQPCGAMNWRALVTHTSVAISR